MVQVREIDPRNVSEAEYEDVNESDYTDTEEEEGPATSLLTRLLPSWSLLPGRWSTKLWGRLQHIGKLIGNIAWIFTTSMLLVGLPVLFAYDREKAVQEQQLLGLPSPANN